MKPTLSVSPCLYLNSNPLSLLSSISFSPSVIIGSFIVVTVLFTVVVVPLIVKFPLTTKLPLIVTRSALLVVSIAKIPALSVEPYEYAEPLSSTSVCVVAEVVEILAGNKRDPVLFGVILMFALFAVVLMLIGCADLICIPPSDAVIAMASVPVPADLINKLESCGPTCSIVKSWSGAVAVCVIE